MIGDIIVARAVLYFEIGKHIMTHSPSINTSRRPQNNMAGLLVELPMCHKVENESSESRWIYVP